MASGKVEPVAGQASSERPKWNKRGVPEGLWQLCPGCQSMIYRKEAEKRLGVCPECDYHWYVSARERIAQVLDEGTFEEWYADLEPADPLGFADKKAYADRLKAEQKRTGHARRGDRRLRHDPRPPRGVRRHRFGIHHGKHGLGRRRKTDPAHRAGHAPSNSR